MRVFFVAVCSALFISGSGAHAATITHGFLNSDDATYTITDTNTGRQYTQFDAFDWTVAETEAAIGAGGDYEGWSIATGVEADEFIAASLGVASTPCDGVVGNFTDCGTISSWTDGDFGASHQTRFDYFAYYGTNSTNPIGLTQINSSGVVYQTEAWNTASWLDDFDGIFAINLLLYKDVSEVPLPAALPMLLAGLGALGFVVRRRKATA